MFFYAFFVLINVFFNTLFGDLFIKAFCKFGVLFNMNLLAMGSLNIRNGVIVVKQKINKIHIKGDEEIIIKDFIG